MAYRLGSNELGPGVDATTSETEAQRSSSQREATTVPVAQTCSGQPAARATMPACRRGSRLTRMDSSLHLL